MADRVSVGTGALPAKDAKRLRRAWVREAGQSRGRVADPTAATALEDLGRELGRRGFEFVKVPAKPKTTSA